jgi:hypothetical protein
MGRVAGRPRRMAHTTAADGNTPDPSAGPVRRLHPAGSWTRATLALIVDRPGVAAAELAEERGSNREMFERDVRKLKELGLTHSLSVGYELSPRGLAICARDLGDASVAT